MSIFAPDAFPEWVRVFLFWVGVALLIVGVAATSWHYRPKGWLKRHVSWRFQLRPPVQQYTELPTRRETALQLPPVDQGDSLQNLFIREKRVDLATAAMGRLRKAIDSYPEQIERVRKFDSNRDIGSYLWDGLGHSARDEIANISDILRAGHPGVTLMEFKPPITAPKGAVPISHFDEENGAEFLAAHKHNQRVVIEAMHVLERKLAAERKAVLEMRARIERGMG